MERSNISGAVLAGGRGSRLDGQDKGLVTLGGQTMIKHVIDRFLPQVATLSINANRNLADYQDYGYPVVVDDHEDYPGPLAGIAAMLARCPTPYLAIAPCDTPFLPLDFVQRLAEKIHSSHPSISVAVGAGRMQPVFALIPTSLQSDLNDYISTGGRRIVKWYERHNPVSVEFANSDAFDNINTIEDIERAEARLADE